MVKTTFAHVGLNCKNLLATEKFYCKHFGFKRARFIPVGKDAIVFLRSGSICLELFKAKGTAKKVTKDGPTQPGVRHLAFQVANVDKKLKEIGKAAKVTFGPFSFDAVIKGWRTAWIQDPDGRIVEVSQGYKDQKNPPGAK